MKFYLLLLLFPCSLFAQVSSGSFMVGGGISITHSRQENPYSYFSPMTGEVFNFNTSVKTTYTSISPTIGYFIIDRFCLGISLPFSFSNRRVNELDDDVVYRARENGRAYNFGPFVKYYVPLSGKFFALAEAGYGWGYYKTSASSLQRTNGVEERWEMETKDKMERLSLAVGIAYFINENTGVELTGQYQKSTVLAVDQVSVSAKLGLQIYLSR
jgi:hypothetical protein